MTHLYRGASLSQFNQQEFATGEIAGGTYTVYRGTQPREGGMPSVQPGTPIEDVPSWSPEGEDRKWMVDKVGVTGGLTGNIGTAVTFGGGVPMLLYLDESRTSASRLQYTRRDFNTMPGALPHVTEDDGEIRYFDDNHEEQLVGLLREEPSGMEVHRFGIDAMERESQQYNREGEWVHRSESLDISRALDGTATFIQRRQLGSMLDALGFEEADMSEAEMMRVAHSAVISDAQMDITPYWLVLLDSQMLEQFPVFEEEWIDRAYDGDRVRSADEVPAWVRGGE